MVKEFAQRVKKTCLNEKAIRDDMGEYKERSIPQSAIIFSLKKSRLKVIFNGNTRKLVSAQRVRAVSFNKYIDSITKRDETGNG